MANFNQDINDIAQDLLQKFGDKGFLVKNSLGSYNPGTGKTSTSTTRTAVYYVQENYSLYEQSTGLVNTHDLKVTIAVPLEHEEINELYGFTLFNGTECNILQAKQISTQSTIVLYELQVRTKV